MMAQSAEHLAEGMSGMCAKTAAVSFVCVMCHTEHITERKHHGSCLSSNKKLVTSALLSLVAKSSY